MPSNTDIHELLTEDMKLSRELHSGKTLYVLPVYGGGRYKGVYLYRAMTVAEATNWFTEGWLPESSGIPWSTNWEYSRDNYLKGECTVQVEVPAHDILARLRTAGVVPKYEGDGETWGMGPASEIGFKATSDSNAALVALFNEMSGSLPANVSGLTSGQAKGTSNRKKVSRELLRKMFKDKMNQARVVARIL